MNAISKFKNAKNNQINSWFLYLYIVDPLFVLWIGAFILLFELMGWFDFIKIRKDGKYCLQKPLLVLQIPLRRLHRKRLQAEFRCVMPAVDAALLVLNKIQRMGISINRAVEEGSSHKNYFVEYHPRRNRLTHSLIFEEFEMIVEDWDKLEREYLVSKPWEMKMEEDSTRSLSFDAELIRI